MPRILRGLMRLALLFSAAFLLAGQPVPDHYLVELTADPVAALVSAGARGAVVRISPRQQSVVRAQLRWFRTLVARLGAEP